MQLGVSVKFMHTIARNVALCCLLSVSAFAATTYDRVLLPVMVTHAPGAMGSMWSTEFLVHNPNTFFVEIGVPLPCKTLCVLPLMQPKTTYKLVAAEPADAPGLVLSVQQPSENLSFYTRVYDETRQGDTYGTELPAVREQEFRGQALQLLDLPTATRFRVMLRVYAIDAPPNPVVTVRAFATYGTNEYGSFDLPLSAPTAAATLDGTTKPFYLALPNVPIVFNGLLNASGKPLTELFNIEITPKTVGLKIWGFATVTHNDTETMTTITPH
jgi:hypothetical protein